jgi:murein L,D-transpeptidase YcbB/YkuD
MRLILAPLLVGLAGCTTAAERAPRAPAPAASRPALVTDAERELQRRFGELWRTALEEAEPLAPELARVLAEESSRFHDAALLRQLYPARGTALRFVVAAELGPSPLVSRLREALAGAGVHALDPSRYPAPAIAALASRLQAVPAALALPSPPTPAELRATSGAGAAARLRALTLAGAGRLAARFAEARAARRERLREAARLELQCADALARYARDLSRGNTRPAELAVKLRTDPRFIIDQSDPRPGEAKVTKAVAVQKAIASLPPLLRLLAEKGAEPYLRERLRQELVAIRDRAGLEAYLAALPPRVEQYARLQRARARYRAIVAAGGWQPVQGPQRGIRRGRRHTAIPALRRRLIAEGFLDGKLAEGDRYDPPLEAAVRAYQESHQMDATGIPDRQLWASLSIPAARRLRAIELTMERWRESAIEDPAGSYLLVNIPDFHVEAWKGGKRLARIRVVVGKASGEKCDEETSRKVLAYATPIQSAAVKTLVFSPFWNVTRYIKETELDPERGKDPLFYEKNGYEVMAAGTPKEWVRELPGPANSLGFVKFLFPNPHDTYLHDTPKKLLFERAIRAFSHGCMRVQQPWELAKLLLREDGQWDEARYRGLEREWRSMSFESLKERWDQERYEALRKKAPSLETVVQLRRPVPIHVEYTTVRVDDEGRVHFLADVYRLDEHRLSPRRGVYCVPESKLARRKFAEVPRRLEEIEKRSRSEVEPKLRAALEASRGLDANGPWEVKHLLRQLKPLEKYAEHHRNLAERIRDEHEKLADSLDDKETTWKKALVDRAVRLERLLAALEGMGKSALVLCRQVDRLLAARSRPR